MQREFYFACGDWSNCARAWFVFSQMDPSFLPRCHLRCHSQRLVLSLRLLTPIKALEVPIRKKTKKAKKYGKKLARSDKLVQSAAFQYKMLGLSCTVACVNIIKYIYESMLHVLCDQELGRDRHRSIRTCIQRKLWSILTPNRRLDILRCLIFFIFYFFTFFSLGNF